LAELAFEQDLYEVLVIDNGSTDETKETTLAFGAKIKSLRYVYCECPGLVAARHKGLEESSGEILCFIDDDSFVSKGWLKGVADAFSDKEIFLVGGPCLPEYEIEPPRWLSHFWSETPWGRCLGSLSLLDFGHEAKKMPSQYVFGCNFNIRKDVLVEIGGFHPDAYPKEMIRYRGDGESYVSEKIGDVGIMALYWPGAEIRHFVPSSRMTKEYFCYRGYIQGISNSFAQIRREHGLDTATTKDIGRGARSSKENKNRLWTKLAALKPFFRRARNWMKYRLTHYWKMTFESDYVHYIAVKSETRRMRDEGFIFHQTEVRRDPKLLKWVLKGNYLGQNVKMPE